MATTKGTIQIEGMHCASCVASVERSLKTIDGVKIATVNLATETASVEYDTEKADREAFRRAVENVGYTISGEAGSDGADIESELDKDQRKIETAKRRMWAAWGVTIPVILWMLPEMFFGYHVLGKLGFDIGMVVLSSVVLFGPGHPTIRKRVEIRTPSRPQHGRAHRDGNACSARYGVCFDPSSTRCWARIRQFRRGGGDEHGVSSHRPVHRNQGKGGGRLRRSKSFLPLRRRRLSLSGTARK